MESFGIAATRSFAVSTTAADDFELGKSIMITYLLNKKKHQMIYILEYLCRRPIERALRFPLRLFDLSTTLGGYADPKFAKSVENLCKLSIAATLLISFGCTGVIIFMSFSARFCKKRANTGLLQVCSNTKKALTWAVLARFLP
jgi:hypothetical protein